MAPFAHGGSGPGVRFRVRLELVLSGQRPCVTFGSHRGPWLRLILGFKERLLDFQVFCTRQSYRDSPAACYFCNDVTAPSASRCEQIDAVWLRNE